MYDAREQPWTLSRGRCGAATRPSVGAGQLPMQPLLTPPTSLYHLLLVSDWNFLLFVWSAPIHEYVAFPIQGYPGLSPGCRSRAGEIRHAAVFCGLNQGACVDTSMLVDSTFSKSLQLLRLPLSQLQLIIPHLLSRD